MNDPRNQCDGCMRGLPVVNGIHQEPKGGMGMGCSAHKYAIPECGTLSKFYMDGMIRARSNGERYGQALFNLLTERHPFLAEQIRGSDRDPFYLSGPAQDFARWDRFAAFIEQNWY